MERRKSYELPILDIDKAMKVIRNYLAELDELKREGLTEKQSAALAEFTRK